MSLPHTPSEQKASITRIKENGIQVIKEHRNELPADTHDGNSLRRAVRVGHGLRAVEFIQLRREAAGENLRAGQRQVAHPRALARPFPEPSGRGAGTCQAVPRTVLHTLARQGGH